MTALPQTRRHLAAVTLLPLLLLAACGGASSSSGRAATTSPRPSPLTTPDLPPPTPTPAPAPTSTPAPAAMPPTQPPAVIIQVENVAAARPQAGLSDADVVVEYEVEGGLTRFSTVFFHTPATAVGPVRSARTITVQLSHLLGGLLLFSGADTYVLGQIRAGGLSAFDEDTAGGALYRIGARFPPHNLYTDGGHVGGLLQRSSPTAEDDTVPRAAPAAGGGVAAARVVVPVSVVEQPVYTWDAARGGYTRTERDTGLAVDAATRRPWEPAAIVVLQVPVSVDPYVVDAAGNHGLDHDITDGGPAQVLVGGRLLSGHFTQGASGFPQVLLDDGTPAPLPAGHLLFVYTRLGFSARPV